MDTVQYFEYCSLLKYCIPTQIPVHFILRDAELQLQVLWHKDVEALENGYGNVMDCHYCMPNILNDM